MPLEPFTPEWAAAIKDAINASEAYRRAGHGWRWPIALVLEAHPDLGIHEDVAVVLELDRGRCRAARVVHGGKTPADYVLRGSYGVWKALVRGRMEPIAALVRGRIRLVHGSLARLLLHARAANALVRVAASVDMVFPDERGDPGGGPETDVPGNRGSGPERP